MAFQCPICKECFGSKRGYHYHQSRSSCFNDLLNSVPDSPDQHHNAGRKRLRLLDDEKNSASQQSPNDDDPMVDMPVGGTMVDEEEHASRQSTSTTITRGRRAPPMNPLRNIQYQLCSLSMGGDYVQNDEPIGHPPPVDQESSVGCEGLLGRESAQMIHTFRQRELR